MTDDLPFLTPEPDPSRPERPSRKCYRHLWEYPVGSFAAVAPCGVCAIRPIEHPSFHDNPDHLWTSSRNQCSRCHKFRDEAIAKRNRRNRQRGGAFERTVAKQLGGRKTGPLGGRDDVMVGGLFAIQTKRAQRFALTEARTYLDDLRRTYPTRTPLVVHALPGERGGVVILTLADWVSLHGSDGQEEAS